MPVFKRTSDIQHQKGFNILVYGGAGIGKTSLIPTLPTPIILSAEGGLASIMHNDLPYIDINSIETLREATGWLTKSKEAQQYESIAVDSISEIAEFILAKEKEGKVDQRAAYGVMQEKISLFIRSLRDIPLHVYATAKLERAQDETQQMLYSPSMPGTKLGNLLPYFFDEVLALRIEAIGKEGIRQRALQCHPDGKYVAKDRSGKLDPWEIDTNLGKIITKMASGVSK